MSVELVNGHVLIPLVANYASGIGLQRRWIDDVCSAEFGNESRFALSAVSRHARSFRVTPSDVQATERLIDQLMAAAKSGLACCPFYGYGIQLSSSVIGDTAVINSSEYPIAVGQKVILIDPSGRHDVREIDAIAGDTLTFDSPVTTGRMYPEGSFMWPLLFGKVRIDNMQSLLEDVGECRVTIAEQVSAQSATVGEAAPPLDGIGGWIIEDTFEVQ